MRNENLLEDLEEQAHAVVLAVCRDRVASMGACISKSLRMRAAQSCA